MKHIIITKLFEFGGGNTHLKTLINYFGRENVILVLENQEQLGLLKNIIDGDMYQTKILGNLHEYAHLSYRFTTNAKELFSIIQSIVSVLLLSIKHGFADVTISAMEPEKHLYLLWLPFIKVTYILHSTPSEKYTWFTSSTCNRRLGKLKKIITVSNANKNLMLRNWTIVDKKAEFTYVVHNCIIESLTKKKAKTSDNTGRYILTLGHVIDYKNPFIWLEVAKQITSLKENVHFIWLGSGPLLEEFKIASKDSPRITFQGSVTDPNTYLQNATIYYQPSLQETHGISVLEAMSNYLPCVVSDVGGLPESVKHQYNGITVNPFNVQENIDAIIQILDSEELQNSYGSNSHERYLKLFTYATFKKDMETVYNS